MSITALALEAPTQVGVEGASSDELADRLDRVLADLSDRDLAARPDAQVVALVRRLRSAESRLAAARLAAVHEIDRRGATRAMGATGTAAWLRAEGMGAGDARREVALAEALDDHEQTRQALADGQITTEHATVITREVDALSGQVAPEDKAKMEATLLGQAAALDPKQLRDAARRAAARIDPTGSGDLARAERIARAQRELVVFRGRDGMHHLSGRLDTEGAAALMAALDPLSAPRPSSVDGPDPRTPARRRGDALVTLARLAMAAGDFPSSGGLPAQVYVTMTLEQLTGEGGETCAEIAGATVREPISAGAARRIACDAGIIPVVLGGPSQILDLGRAARIASPAQRRALALRDGGCTGPGCDRPPAWTQVHHIVPWSAGGHTDLADLTLTCDPHHDLAHHGGWSIHMGSDGRPVWTPPPDPPPHDPG